MTTNTNLTSHHKAEHFIKLEDRGVDWNLNILRLFTEPIRGPGRSKCILGGGRSLVVAQIHCQKQLPLLSSCLSSAAFFLCFCRWRRARFVAQGIQTTSHHYSLSDAGLPSTSTPNTTTRHPTTTTPYPAQTAT